MSKKVNETIKPVRRAKAKQLKTNMKMTVSLGNYGEFEIYHLTQMGDAHQIMKIGNQLRVANGYNPIRLDSILRKQKFWEFAISYYNSEMQRELEEFEYSNCAVTAQLPNHTCGDSPHLINSVDSTELTNHTCGDSPHLINCGDSPQFIIDPFIRINFKDYKDSRGNIQYSKLINRFPKLITAKEGRDGGTYMNIYLLIKLATELNSDLEVEIYRIFIEGRLLANRDKGGMAFKEINALMAIMPERIARAKEKGITLEENKIGYETRISIAVNAKINGKFSKGWNDKDVEATKKRAKLLSALVTSIELGFINSYRDVINTIERYKVA